MSDRINSIHLEKVELLDRTVTDISKVQSIRVHPINGSFLVSYPIAEIEVEEEESEDFTGNIIIYPQNPTNDDYSSTTIKTILDYGDLDFPLDTCWNPFNRRYWIADAGNGSVIALSSIDNSFIRSVDGFTLPHSIILNRNNRTIFVKSFVDESTQKITQIDNRGEILLEFEFPGTISSTEIEYDDDYLIQIPKYFTMDYDTNLNRLWFVSDSVLYMMDLDTQQITTNDLLDGRLDDLTCVSIDRSSGNAFVIINDSVNYYIQQIYRDNNLLLGTAYLEEQPFPAT
jgi:hypothetical protein